MFMNNYLLCFIAVWLDVKMVKIAEKNAIVDDIWVWVPGFEYVDLIPCQDELLYVVIKLLCQH